MMAEATTEKSSYTAAFDAAFGRPTSDEPEWLRRLREDALDRFERTGFPTTDEEDWKYTNVAPIARSEFLPAVSGSFVEPDAADRKSVV